MLGETNFIAKDQNIENDYDKVSLVTYRDLDTNDAEKDFVVQLNEEIDMVYGIYLASHQWKEHSKRGYWSMKLTEGLGNPDYDPDSIFSLNVRGTLD